MLKRIEALHDEAKLLRFEITSEYGAGSELTEIANEACLQLQDILFLARYPNLRRMNVVAGTTYRDSHFHVRVGVQMRALCGWHDPVETVLERHVPTCPRCIAILMIKDLA